MCNTTKTKLQCSGHIYNHLFDAIERYTPYCTCWITHNKKLLPDGKDFFQINGRYFHAYQCVKSRIINKAIDYILSIDTFENQCVVIEGMLLSPCLEDHMKTIFIDKSLCNRYSF